MKKYLKFSVLCMVVFLLGAILGRFCLNHENMEKMESSLAASFLEGVTGIFSSEPTEVQNLRKEEIVMQDEGHQEYYFKQLNEEEKRAYRQILNGVRDLKQEFYLTISDAEQLDRSYHAVLKDHPELFWIHNKNEVYRTTYDNSEYCLFSPGYSYTETEIRQIQQQIDTTYQELCWSLPADATEYEKIKAVYTHIVDETDYVVSDHDQNIAGVFYNHEAVCAGYARAIQYLLERMGIFCIYVDGEVKDRPDGHAWNIVQIENEYYYIDATNADQPEFLMGDFAALAEHKTTIMDYLCPFPKEYEACYFANEEFEIPVCTSNDKNFYVINNGCMDSYDKQSLYDYCCMRIDNNAAVVRFKFSNQEAFESAIKEYIDGGAVQNVAQYYMKAHGLRQIEYHYGILDDLKTIYFIF